VVVGDESALATVKNAGHWCYCCRIGGGVVPTEAKKIELTRSTGRLRRLGGERGVE